MQFFRDIGRVRAQRLQARGLTAVGVVLLVTVLILSNVMTSMAEQNLSVWILLSYGGLIAGFICFNAGLQGLTKWSEAPGRPRQDKVLDSHLRRLNDRYAIFHYLRIDRRTYDHVVVHPGGVTVLIGRSNFGKITYRGGRWTKGAKIYARLLNLSGPPVGNPHADAAAQAQGLQEHLHANGFTVQVDSIIVFTSPRVELTVEDSDIPIRRVEDLSGLLREKSTANMLAGGQRLQIVKLLSGAIQTLDTAETSKPRSTSPVPRLRQRP
ncbi:MAG: NERD domain-containing protein [Chloroflexi bacterium]|nr:NERD domain-containing protein [Chloroflexota bacterium]